MCARPVGNIVMYLRGFEKRILPDPSMWSSRGEMRTDRTETLPFDTWSAGYLQPIQMVIISKELFSVYTNVQSGSGYFIAHCASCSQQWRFIYVQCILNCLPVYASTEPEVMMPRLLVAARIHINWYQGWLENLPRCERTVKAILCTIQLHPHVYI